MKGWGGGEKYWWKLWYLFTERVFAANTNLNTFIAVHKQNMLSCLYYSNHISSCFSYINFSVYDVRVDNTVLNCFSALNTFPTRSLVNLIFLVWKYFVDVSCWSCGFERDEILPPVQEHIGGTSFVCLQLLLTLWQTVSFYIIHSEFFYRQYNMSDTICCSH